MEAGNRDLLCVQDVSGLSLYEINTAILAAELRCTDTETGEFDDARFDELTSELGLEEKVLNVAAFVKSLRAEAQAVKEEAKKLTERADATKKRAERLQEYLQDNLEEGQSFKDSRSEVKWKKSPDKVVVDMEDVTLLSLRFKRITTEANKVHMKTALLEGESPEFVGAHIEPGQKRVVIK